jgi:hypothetical protein
MLRCTVWPETVVKSEREGSRGIDRQDSYDVIRGNPDEPRHVERVQFR